MKWSVWKVKSDFYLVNFDLDDISQVNMYYLINDVYFLLGKYKANE